MSYDPRQAYYDRMTPAAKAGQARISQSQFADSIGGDASNYTSGPGTQPKQKESEQTKALKKTFLGAFM
jgi:hypothetical protein